MAYHEGIFACTARVSLRDPHECTCVRLCVVISLCVHFAHVLSWYTHTITHGITHGITSRYTYGHALALFIFFADHAFFLLCYPEMSVCSLHPQQHALGITDMTDTVTLTFSSQEANELLSAASNMIQQLDNSIEDGEYTSLSWLHLAEQRRARLYDVTRSLSQYLLLLSKK